MLGERIGESSGKVVNFRIVPDANQAVQIEVTFQDNGKILGLASTGMGTYLSHHGPGNTLRGQGQGIVKTSSGDVATWKGYGVGRPTGNGMAASWRGVLIYETNSPKLEPLNKMAVHFEYEVSEDGKTTSQIYEVK